MVYKHHIWLIGLVVNCAIVKCYSISGGCGGKTLVGKHCTCQYSMASRTFGLVGPLLCGVQSKQLAMQRHLAFQANVGKVVQAKIITTTWKSF